ncbi:MAG: hypothetical protein AAGG44_10280, partial [Planctomycetota bacterium]
AQCRLGKWDEAVATLRESQRVERVVYGGDDVRPLTEGYLAISLRKLKQNEAADEAKGDFEKLAERWTSDPRVKLVQAEVDAAFRQ